MKELEKTKYAIRRKLNGYNKCILWRLDENNRYVECLYGYIDYARYTVKIYKDHRKVDLVALALMVPLRMVEGLTESQRAALVKEGLLPA